MFSRRMLLVNVGTASLLPATPVHIASAQTSFEKVQDIPYGNVDGQELLLDVYRPPARETARPAVVLIHGGGWVTGARYDMDWPASELAEAGYVAFSIDYRLFSVADAERPNRWPAQLDDVQLAVRWIRANSDAHGVDPKRIGALGHSAGAHLAAMLGVRETRDTNDPALAEFSSRAACVVALAGNYDTTIPDPIPTWDEFLASFLGGTQDEAPEAYRDLSPITRVDSATAPFLLVQGGRDVETAVEHAWRMATAVRDAGVEVICAQIPDADHFDLVSWTVIGPLTLAFLGKRLQPEK